MGLPHPLTLQRMKITWYGHAAFLIETEGIRIILDPYRSPDCGGYAPIDEMSDKLYVKILLAIDSGGSFLKKSIR